MDSSPLLGIAHFLLLSIFNRCNLPKGSYLSYRTSSTTPSSLGCLKQLQLSSVRRTHSSRTITYILVDTYHHQECLCQCIMPVTWCLPSVEQQENQSSFSVSFGTAHRSVHNGKTSSALFMGYIYHLHCKTRENHTNGTQTKREFVRKVLVYRLRKGSSEADNLAFCKRMMRLLFTGGADLSHSLPFNHRSWYSNTAGSTSRGYPGFDN